MRGVLTYSSVGGGAKNFISLVEFANAAVIQRIKI